jgi:DNA-binding transcriptional regulator YiaG
MTKGDIRWIQKGLGFTQVQFAEVLGVGVKTLANWDEGKGQPDGHAYEVLMSALERVKEIEKSEQLYGYEAIKLQCIT